MKIRTVDSVSACTLECRFKRRFCAEENYRQAHSDLPGWHNKPPCCMHLSILPVARCARKTAEQQKLLLLLARACCQVSSITPAVHQPLHIHWHAGDHRLSQEPCKFVLPASLIELPIQQQLPQHPTTGGMCWVKVHAPAHKDAATAG